MDRPDALVLGSRQFEGDVPLRSRIGNIATRGVMHALLGQKLTDTQTGLRGIPANLLPRLLKIESRGYEFELEMLIAAHHLQIPVVEEPIKTIYEPGNKSSHFNPIIDSMKVYFVLLRFGSVSMMTAVLDNLIFYLAYRRTGHVLGAQILARVFAVTFNYTMVRSSVFYSRQRHKAVLPKYLGLVVVSGTASYGGIRWLTASFAIGAVAAKLLVETFLFFVNFAVQRVFIFKPQENAAARRVRAPISRFALAAAIVLAAMIGIEIYGFTTGHLFAQEIWAPVGIKRFTRFLGAYIFLAAPLLLMFPWSFGAVMALLLLVLTVVSVGVQPVAAAAFFLISACALGTLLMGRTRTDSLCATLLGSGAYVFLMMLVARLPLNYAAVWVVILAIPIALDARGVWIRLREWAGMLTRGGTRTGGERIAFGLLVCLLIAQWFVALKPEIGTDGLAMHLAIPMNIAANHRMTFEPARFLWAVMPMGADWAYSIVLPPGRRVRGASSELRHAGDRGGADLPGRAAVGHSGGGVAAGGLVCGHPGGATGDRVAIRRELPGGVDSGSADGDLEVRRHRRAALSVPRDGIGGDGHHHEARVDRVPGLRPSVSRGGDDAPLEESWDAVRR